MNTTAKPITTKHPWPRVADRVLMVRLTALIGFLFILESAFAWGIWLIETLLSTEPVLARGGYVEGAGSQIAHQIKGLKADSIIDLIGLLSAIALFAWMLLAPANHITAALRRFER